MKTLKENIDFELMKILHTYSYHNPKSVCNKLLYKFYQKRIYNYIDKQVFFIYNSVKVPYIITGFNIGSNSNVLCFIESNSDILLANLDEVYIDKF